ncbi:sulfurtransferase [Roseofilum casamattae]|uniref:Sulfurtransferase n=1 Tax=Roseofilum casamattae BLCC-M143 TaxID=3022442 RepID=A0ABT7BUK4_9CYAN|nr:sulfurtransferase [Roseofilum casamattae]MDJ1182876.1 sulfurtransferase [Roseofilum casamattae BLCC-M143]
MTSPSLLVSPQWLAENIGNPQIAIVDCRFALANPQQGQDEYNAGHIPGAFYLNLDRDLSSPVQPHGGRHPLPDPDRLSAKLVEFGIRQGETLVVAYDSSRMAFAARCWWLLRYLGHENVAILDGGWPQWQEGGYLVSQEQEQAKQSGIFVPQLQRDWVVDGEQIQQLGDREDVVLVDSRDYDRYIGKVEPIDPVAGHIPGAINQPWKGITTESGWSKSVADQQARWQDYQNTKEIWVYCGSGVTACVNLFSLALAGRSREKLYAGSWSDWCSYGDRPIATEFPGERAKA